MSRAPASGAMATSTGRQHRRNASQRAVDVVQDLFVFQSQHALAVIQQKLISLCISDTPLRLRRGAGGEVFSSCRRARAGLGIARPATPLSASGPRAERRRGWTSGGELALDTNAYTRKIRSVLRDRIASFPIKEVEEAKLGLRRFLPCYEASTFGGRRRLLDEQRRFADWKRRFANEQRRFANEQRRFADWKRHFANRNAH